MGCPMGDVVLLQPRRKSVEAHIVAEAAASAQILFFTGVRYQRMTEPTPPKASGGRSASEGGKRKRKRG